LKDKTNKANDNKKIIITRMRTKSGKRRRRRNKIKY
jgi:hypothetical protein